jgi:hypothetical protein
MSVKVPYRHVFFPTDGNFPTLYRSGGHHGREDEFFLAFGRMVDRPFGIHQKTVIRIQRSIHSEVSLHVLGLSEAGVRQLCMDPIL